MVKKSQKRKLAPVKKPAATNKSEQILGLLRRPTGASIPELAKATDWQAHSIRGFLSGTVKKKLGLEVASSREDGKERRYRLAEAS